MSVFMSVFLFFQLEDVFRDDAVRREESLQGQIHLSFISVSLTSATLVDHVPLSRGQLDLVAVSVLSVPSICFPLALASSATTNCYLLFRCRN